MPRTAQARDRNGDTRSPTCDVTAEPSGTGDRYTEEPNDIVSPLLRQRGVFELEGLDDEGEKAREELARAVGALDEQASRFVEQREEAAAKKAARQATASE